MTDEEFSAGRKRLALLLLKQKLRTKTETDEFVALKSRISAEENRRQFVVTRGTPTQHESPMPDIVREAEARAKKARKEQSGAHHDYEEGQ